MLLFSVFAGIADVVNIEDNLSHLIKLSVMKNVCH